MTFHRYVALGDSFTEGVGDPDPDRPNGVRGWADRVAEVLARGRTTSATPTSRSAAASSTAISPSRSSPPWRSSPTWSRSTPAPTTSCGPRSTSTRSPTYDGASARLSAPARASLVFTAFDPGGSAIYRRVRGRFALYNELVREVADRRRDAGRLLADAGVPRPALVGHRPDAHGPGGPPADGDRGPRHPRHPARHPVPELPAAADAHAARAAPGEPRVDPLVRRPVGAPPAHRTLQRGHGL